MQIEELRESIKNLSELPPEKERTVWQMRQADIRDHILNHDPEEFIKWPSISGTMFVGDCWHVSRELEILQSNGWSRWEMAMNFEGFGAPQSELLKMTSGNIIHQAHHLQVWEHLTGKKIEDLNRIVEIGGGYGALARIASDLGFVGEYVIYDLPEMSALQEYYLSDTPGDFRFMNEANYNLGAYSITDLLIGIYSVSEMDLLLRDQILQHLQAGSYLFVYQPEYESMDNRKYFANFILDREEWDWQTQGVIGFKRSKYLIGDKDVS